MGRELPFFLMFAGGTEAGSPSARDQTSVQSAENKFFDRVVEPKRRIDTDVWSESKAMLRNPEYIHYLAHFYQSLNLSGEQTLNWIIMEICHRNDGDFFDYDRLFIDLEKVNISDAFGRDPRRSVNHFLSAATSPPSRLLQKRVVKRAMWFCLAHKSYLARFEQ